MTNTEWENLNDDQRAQALVDAGMSEDDVYQVVDCEIDELEDYVGSQYSDSIYDIIEKLWELEYYDYAD